MGWQVLYDTARQAQVTRRPHLTAPARGKRGNGLELGGERDGGREVPAGEGQSHPDREAPFQLLQEAHGN